MHTQRQPQVVERFAVVGIWVAARQAANGSAEIGLGFGELAAPVQQQAERIVAAAVKRVAAQGFLVIRLGRVGGMAILLKVQAVEKKRFICYNLGRRLGRACRRWDGRAIVGQRAKFHQKLPGVGVGNPQRELLRTRAGW